MLNGILPKLGKPSFYISFLFWIILLILILFIKNSFYLHILFMIFIFAGLSGAWNVLGGLAGQLSIGHSAFFGIGAYTSSLLFVKFGIPPLLGILPSIGVALILGLVIGYPCFRLRGPFFTLATIAIAEVLQILAVYFKNLTGGSEGLSIPFNPSFLNLSFEAKTGYALIAYCFMLVILGITYWIHWSKLGFELAALRDEHEAAESLGVNTQNAKMVALLISGGLTAVGSTIYAQYVLFLEPHVEFSVNTSIDMALISMIGGLGTVIGPAIGSCLLIPIQELLRGSLGGAHQGLHLVIYGGVLIGVAMFMPKGISGFFSNIYKLLLSKLPVIFRETEQPVSVLASDRSGIALFARQGPPYRESSARQGLLEAMQLTKNFGGLQAISDLSFSVERGEILGIIGPNGAGKTTLFNILSGVYKPDKGEVRFKGKIISHFNNPHLINRVGIGRTYQLVKPFDNMSVLENVMVGAFCHQNSRKYATDIALGVLKFCKLFDKREFPIHGLTLADKKRLEMAKALATMPELLLLDEVMAGLTAAEVNESIALINRIRDSGITVVVVEHVMQAIMSLSDRIMTIAQGKNILIGTPGEVTRDIRVIKAYLGEGYELSSIRKH